MDLKAWWDWSILGPSQRLFTKNERHINNQNQKCIWLGRALVNVNKFWKAVQIKNIVDKVRSWGDVWVLKFK